MTEKVDEKKTDSKAWLLGQELHAARRAKGMKQEEAAAVAGCGRQMISALENGAVAKPDADMLAGLADAYGVDVIRWFRRIGYHHLIKLYQSSGRRPAGRGAVTSLIISGRSGPHR